MSHGFAADEKDHGSLDGLTDDDHTQYLNDTRHTNAHSSFRAERATSNQTLADSTTTIVIYNSIIHEDDADGDFTLNTSTGVLTINNAGVYLFTAGIRWANNSTGIRRLEFRLNGTTFVGGTSDAAHSNFWRSQNTIYKCSATDTMEVAATQDSGGNLDVMADGLTFFGAMRVS